MKETELRLNNLVFNSYSGVMIVKRIAEGELYLKHSNEDFKAIGSYALRDVKPIKLTEDFLLNLGIGLMFTHCGSQYIIERGLYGYDLRLIYNLGKSKYIGDIRYVHLFQNLYFALTGEELIYNPKLQPINDIACH